MTRLREHGFTLVEVMITVVIIGILAAVALPSYRAYVERGNRTAGKTALVEIASRQESHFVDRKGYALTLAALDYPTDPAFLLRDGSFAAASSNDAIYRVSLAGNALSSACPPGGSPARTGYAIVAEPVESQAGDGRCGALCLNSIGNKSASGSSAADCWKR